VKSKLVVGIIDVAVKSDVHTIGNELRLFPDWHGKFVTVICGARFATCCFLDDLIEIFGQLLRLGTIKPYLIPVLSFAKTARHNVDHELGRVCSTGALSTVSAEIFFDGVCIVSDVTEVDGLAAFGKKQKGIELSEE
jgi:hypothetical protein